MVEGAAARCLTLAAVLGFLASPFLSVGVNAGESPSAMVEEVSGAQAGIEVFDYLSPGDVIELGAGERLVISYFTSCVAETIVGGRVVVGRDTSEVAAGTVKRAWLDCDGGEVVLAEGQEQEAGAAVFRKSDDPDELPVPDRVIYGTSPLIKFAQEPSALTIERLDADEPVRELAGAGRIVDTGMQGVRLSPDGTYVFRSRDRAVVVKVSRFATASPPAAVSRLVPM